MMMGKVGKKEGGCERRHMAGNWYALSSIRDTDMSPMLCLSLAIITILLLIPAATSQRGSVLKTESNVFGPFNDSCYNSFDFQPMATINLDALQLSPDSARNDSLTNKAGSVFFKRNFTLWEEGFNGKVASFNTSFLFNIYRINNATPGEGMAFVISPSTSNPPYSSGEYLGLTNSYSDGKATNQIVAIELDTMKQDFDPDDNHIGLDINSVRSKITVSLSRFGFQLAPNGTQFYVLWVEYDGSRKVIHVYMASQPDKDAPIVEKPTNPILTHDLDLKGLVNQMSYFGFTASTGDTYELNAILRWNLSVEVLSTATQGKIGNSLKLGLGIGMPLLLVFVVVLVYYMWRKIIIRETISNSPLMSTLKKLPGSPREFRFHELKKATNNFDDKLKLGQGGFGIVYRGTLQKENLEVAVKKFSGEKMKSIDDFLAELTIINRLRHKHLVPLLGWCHKNGVLLLVYAYMPNGSLDKHIFCEEGTDIALLSWQLRNNIILGVASALQYLHNEYDQKVIHRDLKASNIMLDSNFNARLGDFGLARALENGKTSYGALVGAAGTRGYIAPECLLTGKATRESDVYGFGAVLLEVVCGQHPWAMVEGYHFLVDWVWHLHCEGKIMEAVDQRLGSDYVVEEAESILKLGLACSNPIASERPKMQTIVQILSGSVPMPHVPLVQPTFIWPVAAEENGFL